MRIRLLQSHRFWWNYGMHELPAGSEHEGELAHHLAATGAPVEILEHDPEPAPEIPDGAGQEPAASQPQIDTDGLDITGTIDTVLTWVGDDAARALHALQVEQAKGDGARATLTARLQQLAGPPQP